jgi:hypothetical protein
MVRTITWCRRDCIGDYSGIRGRSVVTSRYL